MIPIPIASPGLCVLNSNLGHEEVRGERLHHYQDRRQQIEDLQRQSPAVQTNDGQLKGLVSCRAGNVQHQVEWHRAQPQPTPTHTASRLSIY